MFDTDVLARKLIHMASVYRQMGPSWDKGGITSLVAGAQGEYIGKALPGRGILLDSDLKSVGINRPLPGVFERSPFRRILDRVNDERGAISTYDGIINARGNGKADDIFISKTSTTTASGFWYSLWTNPGSGGTGTYLSSVNPPTGQNRVHGAVGDWGGMLTNPGGSDKKYLIAMGWGSTSAHNWAMLVDRLQDASKFRLTAQTDAIASPADIPSRLYGPSGTLGMGCQLIAPVTTLRGTPGAGNLQIDYRNTASADTNTGASAMTTNADPINRCLPFPSTNTGSPFITLAAGDVGVKRVISATKSATADASGDFALCIVFPLIAVPGIAANTYIERDAPMNIDGLIELANASQVIGALDLLLYAGATTSPVTAMLRTCSG